MSMSREDDDTELLNDSDLIPPSTMQSWFENSAYVEAVEEDSDATLKRPLNADAVLAGIRFLHKFVNTPDGQRAVKQALDEAAAACRGHQRRRVRASRACPP